MLKECTVCTLVKMLKIIMVKYVGSRKKYIGTD